MLTHAATAALGAATHGHSLAGLITVTVVALVILTAGYLVKCWLLPFVSWRCRHSSARAAWRCRRCAGTGRRVRAGRRLINHIRRAHRH